ncbi:MAG TPA: VOC family protein [Pricia sp.]|nr:VOC family protein [Pricia sp.]
MNLPKIEGLLESSLYVSDLDISVSFYRKIFGFETLVSNDHFCALHVSDRQVLLLFLKGVSVEASSGPGGIIPPHDGDGNLHLAFCIAKNELERWKNWLHDKNIEIESEYTWERGGISLYFRDPDHHLLEVATPGLWSVY